MSFHPTPCRRRGAAAGLAFALRATVASWQALAVLVTLGAAGSAASASAQTAQGGSVEGRVQSAATGNFLTHARIRVAGSTREVFTNSSGEYRIVDLPPGPATLDVFFTGMAPQTVSVTIPASGALQRNVVLGAAADTAAGKDGTLVMKEYVVQSQRETDATAIAINEQRFAANRKDVVSTDAFGEINQGNIGEFVKFLPGITLDVKDGNTPSGIMIRCSFQSYDSPTAARVSMAWVMKAMLGAVSLASSAGRRKGASAPAAWAIAANSASSVEMITRST